MAASPLGRLLARLGPEVEDPDEETFLLFAHKRPSAQNLGFVDAHAAVLDVAVAGRDLVVHQSPTVLTSSRPGGTTGAVLWKITPIVADWLARPDNVFFCGDDASPAASGMLGPHSAVLELGCGIAGVIGMALTHPRTAATRSNTKPNSTRRKNGKSRAQRLAAGPSGTVPTVSVKCNTNTVGRYVLTDQAYVAKLVQRNLDENNESAARSPPPRVYFRPLDWETDAVTLDLLRAPADDAERSDAGGGGGGAAAAAAATAWTTQWQHRGFDAVLACDCIYNEALVAPLVQTCADACRLRLRFRARTRADDVHARPPAEPAAPALCIVAQQLRDPDVLTAWMTAFRAAFRVWRVPDAWLTAELQSTAGFAVHVGILRDEPMGAL
ncbi:hypothetical protein SPI_00614 [Niveomyces insectorum RCEF 264]|uniref:Uncharacterized protein n=1 Tax=Niveomyces insectorum RCEF 264 TaxID=1081102 RepID=A0A162MQA2_9HYPO|nr:hypothetical protein SPI_00614 [Niveomyces insectorum RCEF 264]